VIEFVRRPAEGRLYSNARRVRLSDAGRDGVLRLDGAARYLQDVASDDWAESGLDPRDTWVVRRTALRVADGGRWPVLGEVVCLTTWCGGAGAAWAERRTDLEVDGRPMVEAVALWVSLDGSGRPSRLSKEFHDVYGAAVAGRRVSGRVPAALVPPDAKTQPWPVRRADLDVVGHVNNAAVWAAMTEVVSGPVTSAVLTHHWPLEDGHAITLVTKPGRLWLIFDSEVKVSAEFTPA
jgi:acyl-ACP thioesterase